MLVIPYDKILNDNINYHSKTATTGKSLKERTNDTYNTALAITGSFGVVLITTHILTPLYNDNNMKDALWASIFCPSVP